MEKPHATLALLYSLLCVSPTRALLASGKVDDSVTCSFIILFSFTYIYNTEMSETKLEKSIKENLFECVFWCIYGVRLIECFVCTVASSSNAFAGIRKHRYGETRTNEMDCFAFNEIETITKMKEYQQNICHAYLKIEFRQSDFSFYSIEFPTCVHTFSIYFPIKCCCFYSVSVTLNVKIFRTQFSSEVQRDNIQNC